jgi:hypothetical protein
LRKNSKQYYIKELDKKVTNTHRVPSRMWRRWTIVGRHVFNKTYTHMIQNQDVYKHPQAQTIPEEHFKTTAWNAAFQAASICSRGEEALLTELVRDLRGWDRYGNVREKETKDGNQDVQKLRRSSPLSRDEDVGRQGE